VLVGKQADREAIAQMAGQTFEELQAWCQAHPGYTLLELEEQGMLLRQRLMGEMLSKLVARGEAVQPAAGMRCPTCQGAMEDKGRRTRTVRGPEGAVELDRAYYYCPSCQEGFFPSGP
jgi:uncharacterized protein with PIN domain